MEAIPKANVAIVVLNWNGWRDTIACLESVFRSHSTNYRIIICDNGSQDDSIANLCAWAKGNRCFDGDKTPLAENKHAPVERPIATRLYDRNAAETGGELGVDVPLTIIENGANLGFAGGNNVGLRYVLARKEFTHAWLLNNDTVVRPDALAHLVERMQADPGIGMCGSTLVYYDTPDTVQALGGARFDWRRGVGRHLGVGEPLALPRDPSTIEHSLDYVVGASMLVSRPFLESIGLMSEDYFLYFEEIDWAVRAHGQFSLAWAPDSVVIHKEGASIGSSHQARPSALSMGYLYRNRLKFTRRHLPKHLASVLRSILFEILVYLKRRDFEAVGVILNSVRLGLRN